MDNMETKKGYIKMLHQKRGYGFISQEDGTDIFFHCTGVVDKKFDDLRTGMEVEYLATETQKGWAAIGVVVA
jgi:CspA family cold shock protein